MIAFAMEHPVAAFFIIWVVCYWSAWTINRVLRAVNIARAGWPPPHLDADGDWQKKDDGDA